MLFVLIIEHLINSDSSVIPDTLIYLNWWPPSTRINTSPPSFECSHASVNLPLTHTFIAILYCYSSSNFTSSQSLGPYKLVHRSLLFFSEFCQWRSHVERVIVLSLFRIYEKQQVANVGRFVFFVTAMFFSTATLKLSLHFDFPL